MKNKLYICIGIIIILISIIICLSISLINNKHSNNIPSNNIITIPQDNTTQENGLIDNVESYSEVELVNYFENMESESENINSSNFKDKVINYFTDIVDFIFYDKEIKGYTFKSLTDEAKLEIIKICLVIDSKIDKYFPDYKSNISNKYQNIKNKAIELYISLTKKICSNNEELCNKSIEVFANIYDKCSIGLNYLNEFLKSIGSKISIWYENTKHLQHSN